MKLYFAPATRAFRPRWMLEEIAMPYDLTVVDIRNNEHKTPEFLKINPLGSIPVFVDGDLTVVESTAICLYLADKFYLKKLAPPPSAPARARYYQWAMYGANTLEAVVMPVYMRGLRLPK